jgi:two-component system sporulation sensor kinase A
MHSVADGSSLYRELVTRAREPMIVIDQRGLIRFENNAAGRLTGEAGKDRCGCPIFDLLHPADHDRLRVALERAGDVGEPAAIVECRARHVDGRWIAVLMMSPVSAGTEDAPHVLLHLHDVGERLALLARIRLERKLASLGHLATGVADDLARLMETIRCQLSHLPTSETPPFFLRVIKKAAETGAALAQQIKAFAEMPSTFCEQVDLHVVLKEVLSAINGSPWLDMLLEASRPVVRTDREFLRQGLTDLVHGFAHAMPEGSVVSVTTRNLSTSRQQAWRNGTAGTEYIAIDICNTARGCRPGAADRFEASRPRCLRRDHRPGLADGVGTHSGALREISTTQRRRDLR